MTIRFTVYHDMYCFLCYVIVTFTSGQTHLRAAHAHCVETGLMAGMKLPKNRMKEDHGAKIGKVSQLKSAEQGKCPGLSETIL